MASQQGHHDVVQTLLGAGADVNIITSDVRDVMCYYYNVHAHELEPVYSLMYVTWSCRPVASLCVRGGGGGGGGCKECYNWTQPVA